LRGRARRMVVQPDGNWEDRDVGVAQEPIIVAKFWA
jgi:hypothetical protein